MKIGKKKIGKNYPAFLIAEAGVNHNGSLKIGKKLNLSIKSCITNLLYFYFCQKLINLED